jgi:hypothetical protein
LIRTQGYADCHINHVFEVGILRYADEKNMLLDLDAKMFENLDYHNLIEPGLVIEKSINYRYDKQLENIIFFPI